MEQKFSVGLVVFPYGGNGSTSSEVPDVREWMLPTVLEASRDPRISGIRVWNISNTPITMTRNLAVVQARQQGIDILVMIDSDMRPDLYVGQDPLAKPWFKSSFDFLVEHYHRGPVAIGAPYCGPPPVECVYVFRWQNMQNEHPNPDFQLEMYDRHTATKMTGIQECAALPTGLIMYDMRCFDLTEPKTANDKPWFYYEWKDIYASEKASTEDVTQTRDLSLTCAKKLGYNPVFCNWDAWAGHWKPKCVGKPVVISAGGVSEKLTGDWVADTSTKLIDFKPKEDDQSLKGAPGFHPMGMGLPECDADAITRLVENFKKEHSRPPKVLEVGSWAGRSALIMAQAGATVTCVDTWEGNPDDEGCKEYDGSAGTPFEVFKKNVAGAKITPVVGKSPEAAVRFKDKSFDIVYIDARHTKPEVKADIEAWKPKAKYILAGHDYHSFPDVAEAVAECGLVPQVEGNVWSCKA